MEKIKAKDIMTKKVITISHSTSIREADEILKKNKITGLPVVDKNGKMVGIVSEKHLLSIYDVKGEEVDEYAFRLPHEYRTWVEEIMTKEVVSVDEETSLKEICEIMVKNHIHRVPVLREKKVVGIISTMDLAKYLLELLSPKE
jgi:CBS domain-containing protein